MNVRMEKLFIKSKNKAVQPLKKFKFEGDILILSPTKANWGDFFDSLNGFSDDFMSDRNQPKLVEK